MNFKFESSGAIRILILTTREAELLEELLKHEILRTNCFEGEFAIETKQELIELHEKIDG